jgi:hypothetical protein
VASVPDAKQSRVGNPLVQLLDDRHRDEAVRVSVDDQRRRSDRLGLEHTEIVLPTLLDEGAGGTGQREQRLGSLSGEK